MSGAGSTFDVLPGRSAARRRTSAVDGSTASALPASSSVDDAHGGCDDDDAACSSARLTRATPSVRSTCSLHCSVAGGSTSESWRDARTIWSGAGSVGAGESSPTTDRNQPGLPNKGVINPGADE